MRSSGLSSRWLSLWSHKCFYACVKMEVRAAAFTMFTFVWFVPQTWSENKACRRKRRQIHCWAADHSNVAIISPTLCADSDIIRECVEQNKLSFKNSEIISKFINRSRLDLKNFWDCEVLRDKVQEKTCENIDFMRWKIKEISAFLVVGSNQNLSPKKLQLCGKYM